LKGILRRFRGEDENGWRVTRTTTNAVGDASRHEIMGRATNRGMSNSAARMKAAVSDGTERSRLCRKRHRANVRRRVAAAVRRCKIRKRAGLGLLHVEVPLGPLADRLSEDRFLAEWDSENRTEIERALQRMLTIYILGANALPNPRDG